MWKYGWEYFFFLSFEDRLWWFKGLVVGGGGGELMYKLFTGLPDLISDSIRNNLKIGIESINDKA